MYCKVPASLQSLYRYQTNINQKKKMETQKKLFRIKNGKEVLGGVCQGLAEYFNTDVLIFRLAFVFLLIAPLPSIVPYLILCVVLPKKESWANGITTESDTPYFNINETNSMNQQPKQRGLVGGVILIILGVIFSIKEYLNEDIFEYIGKAWPLFLIGLGAWMIFKERPNSNNSNF
jgi:phage shock protein C